MGARAWVTFGHHFRDFFTALESSAARCQTKQTIAMQPHTPRRHRRFDRFGVASLMVERPRLVSKPCRYSRVAGTETQAHLERSKSVLVATVVARHHPEIEMTKREVGIQLNSTACMGNCRLDVASPVTCLGQHVLWVFRPAP